jgi:hypothetical protein
MRLTAFVLEIRVTRKIGTPNDAAKSGRASWIAAEPNAHRKNVEKSGALCQLRILLLVILWLSQSPPAEARPGAIVSDYQGTGGVVAQRLQVTSLERVERSMATTATWRGVRSRPQSAQWSGGASATSRSALTRA